MEPIERWIGCVGPSRAVLLEPLRVRLEEPITPPDDASDMIEPLQRLLQTRDLPAPDDPRHIAIAEEWADRFGFNGDSSRRTGVLGEAEGLLIHLAGAGLIEPQSESFGPTARLTEAAGDPVRLWELIADTFLESCFVFASQPELALAHMARRTIEGGDFATYKEAVLEAVMVEERPSSIAEVETIVGTLCSLIATVCRGLLMTAPEPTEGVATVPLTPGGLRLALRALRAAALSDDRYMWALDGAGVLARN